MAQRCVGADPLAVPNSMGSRRVVKSKWLFETTSLASTFDRDNGSSEERLGFTR
jgi:hypothetical protein